MNLFNQDVYKTCKRIDSFVKKLACCEVKIRLISYREYLTPYIDCKQVTTNNLGTHYVSCVWSHPGVREGPDTCECFHVRMVLRRVNEELSSLLTSNKCVQCSIHCNPNINNNNNKLINKLSKLFVSLLSCFKK